MEIVIIKKNKIAFNKIIAKKLKRYKIRYKYNKMRHDNKIIRYKLIRLRK